MVYTENALRLTAGGGGGGVGGQPGSLHTKVRRCLYSLAIDLPCFPFRAVSVSSRLAVRH